MPREKELFRDNIERLDKAFPNQEMLRRVDVCKFCGINYRTAEKMFSFKNCYISKAKLASELS